MARSLLTSRRFAPLMLTQFLGALNDHLLRNALVVLVSFGFIDLSGLSATTAVNLSAAVFILPFFLLSATAGQLADKYDKAMLIRALKLAELGVVLIAGIALASQNLGLLLLTLLLMGTQSAFFGPLKLAIVPQHLPPRELTAGNAWIELGTFLAIIGGTILGGVLMLHGAAAVTGALVALAGLGVWASRHIPAAPSSAPDLHIRHNPWTQSRAVVKLARRDRALWGTILCASWFWMSGAMLLALLPDVGATVLHGTPAVVTALLVAFCVGIAAGSLLCERLSGTSIELGLVAPGAVAMAVFGLHLATTLGGIASIGTPMSPSGVPTMVYVDLLGLGLGGGLFIVPVCALMQQRAEPSTRSRVIAANNVVNALFVVAGSALGIALAGLGLTSVEVLVVLGLGNVLVALLVYRSVPDRTLRVLIGALVRVMYRFRTRRFDRVPATGAALLVCNHISFVDALLIGAASRRPVRFVMDHRIYRARALHWLFRTVGTIPIAPRHEDPEVFEQAFTQIAERLRAGELVCIFPEGKITYTGELNEFRRGVEHIVATTPVPVIPMALRGLWGSFFSRKHGPAMRTRPRRFRARVELRCGEPVAPGAARAHELQDRVQTLLAA